MDYFFTNVMIALGISTAPSPAQFLPLGRSETALYEIDTTSIRYTPGKLAYSVKTRLRVTPNIPVVVVGKKKLGSYYLDDITMRCEKDDVVINEMTLFAADGEALASDKSQVVLANPKLEGHLITELLSRSCQTPDPKLMAKL